MKKNYGKDIETALSLWVKLSRAYNTFNNLASENIRKFGLTPAQFGVVECLGHLGPMLIGEISRKNFVSCGNTTVVVDNLEKMGIVKRSVFKKDRRAFYVSLTTKGKKIFNEIFIKHAEYITSLASVLTESEQIQLSNLLKKLGLSLRNKIDEKSK